MEQLEERSAIRMVDTFSAEFSIKLNKRQCDQIGTFLKIIIQKQPKYQLTKNAVTT